MHYTSFEEQRDTRYIRENVVLALLSSAVFQLQNRVTDFFHVSPNILAKN